MAIAVALLSVACGRNSPSRVNFLLGVRQGGIDRGTLMIPSEKLSDAELSAILADPRVPPLTELSLHNNQLTTASVRMIVSSPKLTALKTLDLSNNPLGDEGVTLLANPLALAPVRWLSLAAVGATGSGVRALAASPGIAQIPELHLGFQNIGTAAGLLVSQRDSLFLQKAGIDGSTAVTLLRTARVKTLVLNENPLGSLVDLDTLSPSIVALDLVSCGLNDLTGLTQATAAGLLTLNVDYNPVGDAGLFALAQASWLGQLKFLSAMGAKSSPGGRQALRSAWGERPGLTIER